MAYYNRRKFLSTMSATGFGASTGLLSAFASSQTANAMTSTDYKALVCIFFKGGLDAIDTLLPFDQPSYDTLRSIRRNIFDSYGVGSGSSSRDLQNLIELGELSGSGGRRFALPPEMSRMAELYQSGDLAVVGNVGPLIEPVTRSSILNFTSALPRSLFSHNDQQSTWMSGAIEGQRNGWGADYARLSTSEANRTFAAVTAGGSDIFLNGGGIQQYVARAGGVSEPQIVEGFSILGSARDSDSIRDILRDHFSSSDVNSDSFLVQDIANIFAASRNSNSRYFDALQSSAPLSTDFPTTGLGSQLQVIAKTIQLQSSLNANRQVFYATIGGFDTHSGQTNDLPDLQQEISDAIWAFQNAMNELSLSNQVTTFTGSDFGRTLTNNGDGTDHGWGGHHFVVGGAVKGQNILGTIPEFDVQSEAYTQTGARMIPTTSVDEYAATLGRWFGISDTDLSTVLPFWDNFGSPILDLF